MITVTIPAKIRIGQLMAELDDLSITDGSNTARFPENMQFRDVNDSARALEGLLAREFKDRNMSLAASGSSNAFTVTTNRTITSLTDSLLIGFTANHTITGSPTINVNGLGAKTIVSQTGTALGSGDIVSGQKLQIAYRSATADWQVVGGRAAGSSADVLARVMPVGAVLPWPGSTAPSGFLLAYGQAVSRTTYAELFTAYGTTYGAGDGSTTFNLPDYRGRAPFGDDNMGGSAASRITSAGSGIDGATLGAVGGAQTHTLTIAQIPAHPHTGTTNNTTATVSVPARSGVEDVPSSPDQVSVNIGEANVSKSVDPHSHSFTTDNAGGGGAHNNMPPAIIQNWIILALPALASASTTGVNGLLFQFSNSTSGDPGAGKLGFNDATLSSATGFRISETDATGAPMGPVLATWDDSTSTIRGTLYVYKVGTLSTYAMFQITGTMTDSGAYDSFSATYVGNNGTFADGDQLAVIFVAKGDRGDVGAGIDWQGAWVTATAYAVADGVSSNGASYIATSAHTSGGTTEPGVGASWATVWDVIAARGASGAGSGDMVAANNLSDVANAATAFGNIKQAASDSATGVVELATTAEATTGTDTTRAITAAGLKAHVDAAALTFKTIAVSGQSDVVAESRTDTLTLVEGANITITTDPVADSLTIASSGGSGIGSNLLANGCFRFDQRQTTTGLADDVYCFDRWYALTQTSTITCGAQTNLEDGTPYAIRLTQAQASAQRFGLAQILESKDCIAMRGQSVTLSARVRLSASTTLRYAILEWTGTADVVTSDWVNDWTSATFTTGNFFKSTTTTIAGTNSTALTANTLTDMSLTATISSSATNIAVMFWTESTQAQNVTLDIAKAKLEKGLSATSFQYEPMPEAASRCYRFYQKSYTATTAPGTVTDENYVIDITTSANTTFTAPSKFPEMRATPTMTIYNPVSGASGSYRNLASGSNLTVSSVFGVGSKGFSGIIGTASHTVSQACTFHFVADAEL